VVQATDWLRYRTLKRMFNFKFCAFHSYYRKTCYILPVSDPHPYQQHTSKWTSEGTHTGRRDVVQESKLTNSVAQEP
jgi:hypothetical protein